MRVTMLVSLLAMWSALAGAQTVVFGDLTTQTWTAAQSPYRVVGDTTVVADNTLTIEPGVVVEFAASDAAAAGLDTSRVEFNVAGTLAVNGTVGSPVTFRAWIGTTPGTWYGIFVQSTGSASLTHFDIRHATYGVTSVGAGTALQMSQGTVSASSQCGVSGNFGAPVLAGLVLTGNAFGLCLSRGGTVTNSLMVGNAVYGLVIAAASDASAFSLNHLTIHGNGWHGVSIATPTIGSPSITIKNSLIMANSGYGITRTGPIAPNVFHNDVYGNASGGYENVTPGVASVSVDPHYVNAPTDLRLAAGTPLCGGDDGVTQGALHAIGMCNPYRRRDFNGDSRADLLWRHSSTGENYLYFMNGASIVSEGHVRTVQDANWRIVGSGDFNGDGRIDILWRNASSGENYLYMMDGTAIVDEGFLRTVADASWRVAGVGDLNGDGRDDILWRNTSTGENYAYLMNGAAIIGEGYLRTVADQAWRVAGIGDFDRDGKADILWRHLFTGENYVYFMNGASIANEGYLRTVADAAWQVKGVADFNADGRADILWRNADTGENYIYFMNALAIASEGYLRTVADPSWQIAALGDFDGDFRSDIFWRNTLTGDNYVYLMDGLSVVGEGYARSVADQDWSILNGGAALMPPPVGSAGTEFYLTFPDHMCVADPAPCSASPGANSLLISSITQNSGMVSFMGTSTPFVIASGSQVVVPIPTAATLTSNDTVESKGIRVTAFDPVSVQALSVAGVTAGAQSSFSAEGYLALPVNRLGTQYRVMTNATSDIVPLPGSAFAVVATKDNTTVSITPTALGGIRPPLAPYQIVMNAGQTYQLFNPASGDMTGSQVSADKPVAVFGAHRCANIPSETGFCDHLVEQLPDVTRLGTKFHVAPFAGRTRYLLRVMGTADGTQLSYDPAVPGACAALQSGQYCDVFLTTRHQILSTKPLLVAQYMPGSTDQVNGFGDPSMVLVPPVEQAVTDARFAVYSLSGATQSPHVRVVMPTSGLGTLKLDGVSVDPGVFTAIGSSGYSEASIAVAAGVRRLQAAVPFTAVVYQSGEFASYIYPAASSMSVASP
jgi:hypothetical protein